MSNDNSRIWFTADTHFGHSNIIKYCKRNFHNIYEMDKAICNNINQKVKENDTLYHLGDFSFGDPTPYRKDLQCKNIHLIKGNHDYRIKDFILLRNFLTVNDLLVIREYSKIICLCHYAMKVWPHKHHGAYNLFGHSHGTLADPEPFSIDIGVDTNGFKPYSIKEVISMLDNKFKNLNKG